MYGSYGASYVRGISIAVLLVSKTINSAKTAYYTSSLDGGNYFNSSRDNLDVP